MEPTILGGSAVGPNPGQGCSGYLVMSATTRVAVDLGSGTSTTAYSTVSWCPTGIWTISSMSSACTTPWHITRSRPTVGFRFGFHEAD